MPTISNVYIQTFENNVRHLAQQTMAKLRECAQVRYNHSEKHNWETMDASNAAPKSGVLQPTPVREVPWGRRVSVAATWDTGEAVEHEDPVQMLVDPNSNIAQNLSYSMNRAVDDIIINAATGGALDGAGSSQTFPASQEVGGAYTNEISFDMVTEVQEKFMENDITPDVPKWFIVGPKQVRKLMQLTENTSKDYVRTGLDQLSSTGIAPNWLGFNWIMSTRLLVPAADQLDCLAMTNRALGLSINRDITCQVAQDPSTSFVWRIYCYMTMGAVRVEDKQIVRVKVADTVT